MVKVKLSGRTAVAFVLIIQFGEILCKSVIGGLLDTVGDLVANEVSPIFQTSTTRALLKLETDQWITHYGYVPERHQVITADGYNLTHFRCNSKKPFAGVKKVVVLLPGLICSSDDFAMLSKSLAYVMADADYDVWLLNHRGNFYSRNNLYMNPDDAASGFWNYSFEDIGLQDYPPSFAYIRKVTQQPKLYVIGHSMGTSAMLTLLAVKPEINDELYAVSLMAPIGFLKHCTFFYQLAATLRDPLLLVRNREIVPRESYNIMLGSVCRGFGASFCNAVINILFGASENQRVDSMLPTLIAHTPAGASTTNFLHYAAEMQYGFFGSRKQKTLPLKNFPLNRITVPLSLHHSNVDTLSDPRDVKRLIAELVNTKKLKVQTITEKFNHIDYAWGKNAKDVVYNDILAFFADL